MKDCGKKIKRIEMLKSENVKNNWKDRIRKNEDREKNNEEENGI